MEADSWEYELSLFTEDLTACLLCRHPELHKLSCERSGSPHFTEEMGKCVLLTWRDRKEELDQYLVRDYPSFVESKHCFKQYLKRFVEMQKGNSVTNQILGLSTILLEILFFLHRKGVTHFVRDASSYLFFMLSTVKAEEFHQEGGWSYLASVSAKLSEDYDEETCRQYISDSICNLSTSDAIEYTNIDSTLECPIETLPGETSVSDEHGQEVLSVENGSENESEKHSTNEEIISDETKANHFPKVVLILNKPEDETEKDSTSKKFYLNEVTISGEVDSVLNEPENETEKDSTKMVYPNEATISQDILSDLNKSEKIPKIVSTNEVTLDEVKEKYSQVVPIFNKLENESEENSTNKEIGKEVTDKNSQEVVSVPNKSENGSEKDLTDKEITAGEVEKKHSQEVVSILNQLKDDIENDSTNNEVYFNEVTDTISQEVVSVVNKYEDKPEKDSLNEVVNKSVNKTEKDTINEVVNESEDKPEKDAVNEVVIESEDKPEKDSFNEVVNKFVDKPQKDTINEVVNESEDTPEKDSINEEFAPNKVQEHSRVPNLNKLDDEPKINSSNKEVVPNEVKDLLRAVTVSCESENNPRNNSTKLNSNLSEATYERNTNLKHPNVLRQDPPTTLSSDLTSADSKELTLEYVKPNECLTVSKQSMSQDSVHQDILKSPLEPENLQLTDSSHHLSLNPTMLPKNESLKVKENFPGEESKISADGNKSASNCTSHHTADITEPRDSLGEPCETNLTESDLAKEVDKFLTDEILSHFKVRFLTKDEIDAIKFFPADDVGNGCNIYTFKQGGTIETDLACSRNISTLKNLAETVVLSTEKKSSGEHVRTNDNTVKKCLFKSPKHEMNKKAIPDKTKTQSSEKCGVKNTKSKTSSSYVHTVTPIKIPTRTLKSPSTSSTERNTTETKSTKKINDSPKLKSSSPCFKVPTVRGVPKTHLKSSEKTEQSRNFPVSKAPTEITKSSTESTATVSSKSRKGELSDSKQKGDIVDIPKACEKRKPTNSKTENCPKNVSREKTAGSSSAKSIDQSESKTSNSSKEHLDKKSCKGESSCPVTKCDQNKSNELSTARTKVTALNAACRTRNVQAKNIPTDSKNDKPRWR